MVYMSLFPSSSLSMSLYQNRIIMVYTIYVSLSLFLSLSVSLPDWDYPSVFREIPAAATSRLNPNINKLLLHRPAMTHTRHAETHTHTHADRSFSVWKILQVYKKMKCLSERERVREGDRLTEKDRDRQTDRQTQRQRERKGEKERESRIWAQRGKRWRD